MKYKKSSTCPTYLYQHSYPCQLGLLSTLFHLCHNQTFAHHLGGKYKERTMTKPERPDFSDYPTTNYVSTVLTTTQAGVRWTVFFFSDVLEAMGSDDYDEANWRKWFEESVKKNVTGLLAPIRLDEKVNLAELFDYLVEWTRA